MIVLQGTKERVERLSFSPRGNTLVVPSRTGVQLWADVAAGRPPVVLAGTAADSVQFVAHSGRMVFDGPRVSIRGNSGEEEVALRFAPPHPYLARVAVSPDGRFLVAAQHEYYDDPRGRLVCRSLDDPAVDAWSVQGIYRFPSRPLFLPGGDRFVAMEWWNGEKPGEHGPAWITRDTGTGNPVAEFRHQGGGHVELVQSADRAIFVALSANNLLTVYRTDDLRAPIATVKNSTKKDYTGAAFHPGGRILAATSNDKTVKFYDTTNWSLVGGFDWEVGRLRSVAFSTDGSLAAAGAEKGRIVVWDVDF